MSLSKNEVMNELYNAGLITLGAVATSMVSRKLTRDGLGVTSSVQSILKLATIQRDSLCGSRLRVSQTGQERLRERDEEAQRGHGKTFRGKGKMVRKDGGKEKQDSVVTTRTFGCKQGLRRGERTPSQPENGYGGARRRQGAYAGRVLRTFRQDEGAYEHCYRCYRIGVRLPTHKNFVTPWGYKNNLTEISHT